MTGGTMSIVPLVAFVLTMVGPTFGSVERVTVQVDGMACPFCAFNIEKRMKTLEGVDGKADFTVSVERGRAELAWQGMVEFDPNAVREQIRRAGFTPAAISITVVVGGLVTSTALTLLVLPAIYKWFSVRAVQYYPSTAR